MKENRNIFDAFNAAGLKEWEAAAREELNGASPWEKLEHKLNGWTIRPYYEQHPTAEASQLLPVSGNEFLGARSWFNCPRIAVHDAKKSNETALTMLQQGADGIFFELNDDVDFNVLLENVGLPYCSLNFLAKKNAIKIATSLQSFLKKKKSEGDTLQGAFFGDTTVASGRGHLFKFSGFQIPSSGNPAADIASGFNGLVAATEKNIDSYIHSIAFSVTIGTDFFVELARLRAVRVVWKKFLIERGLPGESSLFIHAVSTPWVDKNFDPHGNMLKSTTAAMASILGGCDALTIDAENNEQSMQLRVARNVSNILREESFFSKVADPVAGSYFIEDLTWQIAEGAWKSIKRQ